jgi:Tfp pilus assembly protein PilO
MSINQKRAVLIIAGVLILACTFFFVYQPSANTVLELETDTEHYRSQISYLSALQLQVTEMKKMSPAYKKEMNAYMKCFPSKMTQQLAIYNVYRLMIKTGIHISSISPGDEQIFYSAGTLSDSSDGSVSTDADAQSTVEENPEKEVSVHEMVGKYTSYDLSISGTLKQIKKALDWVSENKVHMSVTNIALTYDSSNGKLSGSLTVNFYAMNGNGVPYEEPDIKGITIGSGNIFGTVK